MKTVGFAMTGSFCTFAEAITQMQKLKDAGFEIVPIMSQNAYETDTRFGLAVEFRNKVKEITGRDIIHTIFDAEPIGPKSLLDVLVIAPATGNTLAKLANGINDTAVTMAAKAHLRNAKPLVIAIATNDALSAGAQNIGRLLNVKNIYFVPMQQDDLIKKPTSLISDFGRIVSTVEASLKGKQIQPVFF